MTITEYINLIIASKGIINNRETLIISENKEEKDLLRLRKTMRIATVFQIYRCCRQSGKRSSFCDKR